MGLFSRKSSDIPSKSAALKGRGEAIATASTHFISGKSLQDLPSGHQQILFGMGCFWGAERIFWSLEGVHSTSVGYSAGHTPNATYDEVCSGKTGHNEVVKLVFDPDIIPVEALLKIFWEGHNPTQGMAQGNDRGSQYRSGIYVDGEGQMQAALSSRAVFAEALKKAGHGKVTTEILPVGAFYFAEAYHQQYLAKNPSGYCGIGGMGVSCPIGVQA